MGKASFLSESKCRTNEKIMVFNLHKFEPPQIMQPRFTFLTALLHTLHLLYLSSKFLIFIPNYANSIVTQQEKAFPVVVRNYLAYPLHYPANCREDGV